MSVELRRVALVIATFRADDSVIDLLKNVHAHRLDFGEIIVVDSLGSGAIARRIEGEGWNVRYVDADCNLGSAGNLALRLKLAAEHDVEFAYAINHDGSCDGDRVRELVRVADSLQRVGAIYPRRRYVNRGGKLRGHRGGSLVHRSAKAVEGTVSPADWSSSNGALYALEPVRSGLLPREELWMGWEDMAYGHLLKSHGYVQAVANSVIVDDNYEYRRVRLGPVSLHLTDKPTWYQYYTVRNLLLIAREDRAVSRLVAVRLITELGLVALLRDHKLERLRLFGLGARDGVLGRTGKWKRP